jgi:large subunit ribosomal protein L11
MSFVRFVKLRCLAGNARPGPALGQALGPLVSRINCRVLSLGKYSNFYFSLQGINMAEFCKQFNERTESVYEKDILLSIRLSAMSDRSFTFDVRSPPTSYLIKRVVGLEKGPAQPNPDAPVAYITPEAVYEIAKIKQQDEMRWHLPLEGIARSVVGTCGTMGVAVREANDA